jgi:hypothetical protein
MSSTPRRGGSLREAPDAQSGPKEPSSDILPLVWGVISVFPYGTRAERKLKLHNLQRGRICVERYPKKKDYLLTTSAPIVPVLNVYINVSKFISKL